MILGLTGKNASGKGEAANYLKSKGFVYYSLSDMIREEATKRNLEHSRENLIELGNELREKYGPGCLAQKINNEMNNCKKIFQKKKFFVIDSIRSPHEVNELKKNKSFLLIGIDAPIELRFNRLRERNRVGDAKTFEEFKQQEQRENLKSDINQQLDATFGMAKKVIVNYGSLEELHKKIDKLLLELEK